MVGRFADAFPTAGGRPSGPSPAGRRGGRWRRAGRDGLIAFILAGCIAACGDRDRVNPLDPHNLEIVPDPWTVRLVAGDARVTVTWIPLAFEDLTAFTVERIGPSPADTMRTTLAPSTTGLVDTLVQNAADYEYRFLPRLADGRIVAPVGPLPATPGPEVCWVAESGGLRIKQLAPDGRAAALAVQGFRAPQDVSVSPGDGRVWIADRLNRRVVALDRDGDRIVEVTGFVRPRSVAAAADGRVWVADEGSHIEAGAVTLLRADGTVAVRVGDLARPADVAVRRDGSAWLSDAETGALRLFDAGGRLQIEVLDRYVEPLRLAVVDADGSVWLTDDELRIAARVAADGTELQRLDLGEARPFGVAVEQDSGNIWLTMFGSGTVERWTPDGARLLGVGGFLEPLGIDRSPADGTVWVADSAHGEVVKLAPDGTELARLGGMLRPSELSLDLGGRDRP